MKSMNPLKFSAIIKWYVLMPLFMTFVACSSFDTQRVMNKNADRESPQNSESERKLKAYQKLEAYFKNGPAHRFVFTPEGEFVTVFNPTVQQWIEKRWSPSDLLDIKKELKDSMSVKLTPRGFVKAANRELPSGSEKDDTNYDAVWVRDSAWVYLNFQESGRIKEAHQLLVALWDYYSTPLQRQRFKAIIANPDLLKDKMAVPHIRFDGADKDLGDVMAKGQPEVWNHRQMDAHGLFILALINGFENGILTSRDFNPSRIEAVGLFPTFFKAVKFWDLEDAGAWEEVDRKNTSSISIVTRAMYEWRSMIKNRSGDFFKLSEQIDHLQVGVTPKIQKLKVHNGLLSELITNGMKTVHAQIAAGGESPVYDPYVSPSRFRRADAALFNVLIPTPLPGLSESELRTALAAIESLKRPAGILRYINDSYQSGNFWVQSTEDKSKEGTVGTTGDTSDESAFRIRLSALIPHTEAQWFFDSQLAMARLELRKLAQARHDNNQAHQDGLYAALHLKRALGQITGHFDDRQLLTADGVPIKDWEIPESINTVLVGGKTYWLPSPITPLNWAKASLEMAINRYIKDLGQ